MRIFLTGFMGSGKSFWAQKLSARYRVPQVDLDAVIEQKTGQSITSLFAQHGEEEFRNIESACLLELIESSEHFIMSTGGGTPCYNQNNILMKQSGIVVCLKTEAEVLWQRLQHENKHRPLVAQLSGEALLAYIQQSLQQRQAFYETAHHIVDTKSANESIFDAIFPFHV
jgi:shikimate kinase